MKKILNLDDNEKNRILEMHRSAIKKSFLNEQTTPATTADTKSDDSKYAEVDTNKPQRAETELDKIRKKRIEAILSRSPKYGFIEKKTGMLNRTQNLDVQLTNIKITNVGVDTVFVSGKIGEQTERGESPYIGDIVFLYQCKEGEFELYTKPQPNPQYTGISDSETDSPIQDTQKVKKLRKADKGDRYYNVDLSKWLRANLFLCGTKYQPIAQ